MFSYRFLSSLVKHPFFSMYLCQALTGNNLQQCNIEHTMSKLLSQREVEQSIFQPLVCGLFESPQSVTKGSFHIRLIFATNKCTFSLESVKIKKSINLERQVHSSTSQGAVILSAELTKANKTYNHTHREMTTFQI